MNRVQEIWIASDNDDFVTRLSDTLQESLHFRTELFSIEDLVSNNVSAEQPDAVFIDVSDFSSWDELLLLRANWNTSSRNKRSPFIAVFDSDGIPLDHLVEAERAFAGSIEFSAAESSKLAHVINDAQAAERKHGQSRFAAGRILDYGGQKYVTSSPTKHSVFDDLEIVSQHDIAVLIIGETGTGKTSMARLIHELSPRKGKSFLHVACGALPKDLIDSELFGHVKGAFTGADSNRIGKFEAAECGTILLDEIDTLSMEQQVKLLRVLESGEYEKLGSHQPEVSDARVIVASNVCLEEMVERGEFRRDLFFRLNQVKFEIPPLRSRVYDLPALTYQIVQEFKSKHGFEVDAVHPNLLDAFRFCPWPGNIRELRNELRRAALYCTSGVLSSSCLNPNLCEAAVAGKANLNGAEDYDGLSGHVAKSEQEAIEEMLGMQGYNRTATANALGISRVTLYKKIRKYGINMKK